MIINICVVVVAIATCVFMYFEYRRLRRLSDAKLEEIEAKKRFYVENEDISMALERIFQCLLSWERSCDDNKE